MQVLPLDLTQVLSAGASAADAGKSASTDNTPASGFALLLQALGQKGAVDAGTLAKLVATPAAGTAGKGTPQALLQWLQQLDPAQLQKLASLLPKSTTGGPPSADQLAAALSGYLGEGDAKTKEMHKTVTPAELVAMLAAYLQAAQAQPVPPKGGTAPTPQDRAAGMEQSLAKVLAALPEPLQARLQQWASAGKGLPQTATDPALPQATSAQVLPQAAAAETAVPQAGDWPLSWKQVAHKLLTQLPSDPTAGSPRTDKAAADPATALDQALRTLAAATPATHSTPAAPVPAPVLRLQGYPELQRLQQLLGQVQDALSAGNGLTAAAPATLSQAPASTAAAAQGAVPLNLPQPPGDGAWGQALGERVLWMVGQDVQHAQVRLNPPDLGPLEIRVALHNDQASVSFHAQHPFTREAIEAALPRLREMLGDANINLASVDVGQRETGGSRGRQARAGAANGRGVAPVEGVDVSAPPPTVRTAAGLVDDFA